MPLISHKPWQAFMLGGSVLSLIIPALAQDSNILLPIDEVEYLLKHESFEIFRIRGSRFRDDETKRAILKFPGNQMVQVKWKRSMEGGGATNNQPRYEMAAYELQRLFLDPPDFVVPPTAVRAMPVSEYRPIKRTVRPTFKNSSDVIYVLQYWLENVSIDKVFDKKRFEADPTYAWHLANTNILSYLIEHKDANIGNFLVSTDKKNPRVFAVDNGFSFASRESPRGTEWRDIRVKRLPGRTIDRLRLITREDLERTLSIVAQFEMRDGFLKPVEPTENLDSKKGVDWSGKIVQFGLTEGEINRLEQRLKELLQRVESGKIRTF